MKVSIEQIDNLFFSLLLEDAGGAGRSGRLRQDYGQRFPNRGHWFNDRVLHPLLVCLFLGLLLILSSAHLHVLTAVPQCRGSLPGGCPWVQGGRTKAPALRSWGGDTMSPALPGPRTLPTGNAAEQWVWGLNKYRRRKREHVGYKSTPPPRGSAGAERSGLWLYPRQRLSLVPLPPGSFFVTPENPALSEGNSPPKARKNSAVSLRHYEKQNDLYSPLLCSMLYGYSCGKELPCSRLRGAAGGSSCRKLYLAEVLHEKSMPFPGSTSQM